MIQILPQMEPRVGFPHGRVIEIDYVYGYDIRQFPVILPFLQAVRTPAARAKALAPYSANWGFIGAPALPHIQINTA